MTGIGMPSARMKPISVISYWDFQQDVHGDRSQVQILGERN